MGVGKPIIPDYNQQGGSAYPLGIDGAIAAGSRLAFAFAPHETAPPTLTVRLAPGPVFNGSQTVELPEQTTPTISPPGVDPRKDLVVIDNSTGLVEVVTGTEAPAPAVPNTPSGKRPIAEVNLVPGQASILDADLRDVRIGGGNPLAGLELIETKIAAASPTIDFTSGISDAFDQYEIRCTNWASSATGTGQFPYMRISQGAGFISAGNYQYQVIGKNGAIDLASSGSPSAQWHLVGTVASASCWEFAGDTLSFKLTFSAPADLAADPTCGWRAWYQRGGSRAIAILGAGAFNIPNVAVDGFQFLQSSGLIQSGKFSLYGIRS